MAETVDVYVVLDPNTAKLQLVASPYTAVINREIQQIRWRIAVAGFHWPDTGGVVPVRVDPPQGYSPWPGDEPVLNDKHEYVADAKRVLPEGASREFYKYDIFLLNSEGGTTVLSTAEHFAKYVEQFGKDHVVEVDPDIENDPLP
jgi:hypothetical protein